MLSFFIAAGIAAHPLTTEVGYQHLVAGDAGAAITAIEAGEAGESGAEDPAQLINLGIAYARAGERGKAHALFEAAYRAREWVELETASGAWVDSRLLARQALAMLEAGTLGRAGQLARK